jgi:hypothetical protein
VDLLPLPGFVKRVSSSRSSPSFQTFGDRTSTSGPHLASRGLCRFAFAFRCPSRVGAASTPTRRVASREKPYRSFPASSRLKGRCFYPSILLPSTPSCRPRTLGFTMACWCFRGAASTPRRRARQPVPGELPASLLGPAAGGGILQASQGRGSRPPRRRGSAMAAAPASVDPASRALSFATMASSCWLACSSASFTST